MKVRDLITELQKLNPELNVILQKDEEGNGFESARGVEETMVNNEGNALHPDDYKEYGVDHAVVIFP